MGTRYAVRGTPHWTRYAVRGTPRSTRYAVGQDQHAQAQHWLRHAQAQLMHAQHWPRTRMRTRQGGGCPPLPCSHLGLRPMLSMHELSLPESMLSLSMLILGHMSATCPGMFGTLFGTFGTFGTRPERSEHFWTLGTLFGNTTGPIQTAPQAENDPKRSDP